MKRCKRDGEGMNNQGIVNEDRISELPDALIVQILSLLPTEDAIATSVLSKQWKCFWKMVPNLKFDSCRHKLELGNICRSLLLHKAPVLQSLHLKVRLDEYLDSEILILETEILIGIAFARNVRELVLGGRYQKRLKLPKSLYNCETLKILRLKKSVLIDVPSSVRLKSLTTLDLYYVEFKDDQSLVNLLSGCPNLENLVLHGISYDLLWSVKTITIAVPTLQRLSIFKNSYQMPLCCWVINAPSLKYLSILGFKTLNSCLIENVTELVEANLADVSSDEIVNEKLMGSLTLVKRLCLSLPPFKNKFPTGSVFYQLSYLELITFEPEWGNLLTFMLGSSPKLQVLKLDGLFSWGTEYLPERWKWNQPKTVPECLLSHLETFVWKAYKWKYEYEREVAKYILKNTNCLKRATFSFENMSSEDSLVVVNDLKSVVKADNSCQFQFKPYIE